MASVVEGGTGTGRVDDALGATRYLRAAAGLLRSRIKDAVVVGGVIALIDILRLLPQLPDNADFIGALLREVSLAQVSLAATIICAITLAQAAPLTGWRRTALMVFAGLAMVAAKASWQWFGPHDTVILQMHIVSSIASVTMYTAWEFTAVTVALVFYYVTQERESQLAARARDVELERLVKQRAVMESRLAVMRARVEPEFLFGALDEVRGLYRRNRGAADEMVDALITYLRAALPQMRGEASTVQREVDLARAYVAVLQVPRGDGLALDEAIEDDVRDALLPPMVLLPLSQAAFASDDADLRRSFFIEALRSSDGVRIVVAVEGGIRPAGWRNDGPETVRRTLDAYFGASAQLSFGSDGARHWAEVALTGDAVQR